MGSLRSLQIWLQLVRRKHLQIMSALCHNLWAKTVYQVLCQYFRQYWIGMVGIIETIDDCPMP